MVERLGFTFLFPIEESEIVFMNHHSAPIGLPCIFNLLREVGCETTSYWEIYVVARHIVSFFLFCHTNFVTVREAMLFWLLYKEQQGIEDLIVCRHAALDF